MRYFIRRNPQGFYILDSATGKNVCGNIDTLVKAQSILANLADGKQGTFDSKPEAKKELTQEQIGQLTIAAYKTPLR